MNARDALVRLTTVLALSVTVLFTVNCDLLSLASCKVSDRTETAIAKGPGGAKNHFVAVTAAKDGGDADLLSYQDLWGPCRYEVTAGLFDARHAQLGEGSFGLLLFSLLGDSFEMTCTQTAAGIDVSAVKYPGPVAAGTLTFPGAARLDLAIEVTGAQARFLARPRGAAGYQEVGTAESASVGPFDPRLTARSLKKKAVVGFDDARVVGRKPRPGVRSPAKQALDLVYNAGDVLTDAYYAVDGVADLAGAKVGLDMAQSLLQGVRVSIEMLPASPDRSKALAALGKAESSVRKAQALVDNNSNSAKLYKAVRSAVEQTLYASTALRRID